MLLIDYLNMVYSTDDKSSETIMNEIAMKNRYKE